MARIDLPVGPDGKRRQAKRRRATKTEAHRVLRELQAESASLADTDGARRTVTDAVQAFLEIQPSDRERKTIEMEEWRASLVRRGLGERRLRKLSVQDCDAFLVAAAAGEYGRRPLGRDSTRRVRSLLVNVLRNEMRTGTLARNVGELSVLPNRPKRDEISDDEDGDSSTSVRRTLTHEEFRELWRIARWPLLVLVDLCGRNGLRPSEARGLQWDRVDLEEMTLTVNRQMSSDNRATKAKTRRSIRTIPLDDRSVQILTTWKGKQDTKRERSGDRWQDKGLVVTTRYGTAINASNFRRMITIACEEAGLQRAVPYELRHTAITFQCEAGHDTTQVADWAGTSERMIELIYRHRLNRVSQLGPADVANLDETDGIISG